MANPRSAASRQTSPSMPRTHLGVAASQLNPGTQFTESVWHDSPTSPGTHRPARQLQAYPQSVVSLHVTLVNGVQIPRSHSASEVQTNPMRIRRQSSWVRHAVGEVIPIAAQSAGGAKYNSVNLADMVEAVGVLGGGNFSVALLS